MKKTAVSQILPHLGAIALFVVISAIYFLPQIEGKVIPQGDIISHRWMSHEVIEFEKQTGEVSHWTNSLFSGMPTYQLSSPVRGNLMRFVEDVSYLFINRPIGYFVAMMLGMYLLLLTLGVNKWLSVIGALAFGLTTNNFILYEAGHMSKVRAIAFFAPIVAGMIQTYRGNFLWGGVLFAAALAIDIYVNHPQMTYYLAMALSIYVIWQAVADIRSGKAAQFIKASLILLVGAALAVGASFSKIWSTYEYSKDTMRGDPVLVKTGEASSSSHTKGLEWNYAMQWSNGTLDLVSGFIPGVVGGGSQEPVGRDAEIAKYMRSQAGEIKAPLYWGALPFTSGPAYFGAGVVFLFILGLFLVKGQMKWWLGLATLLTLLISMGKHFEILNRALFDYLPMYNNFRAHNSGLAITSLLLPILGILGLSAILNQEMNSAKVNRALMISTGICGIVCLYFAFFGPSIFDFTSPNDERYQQAASALVSDRQSLMRSDSLRSLLIVLLSAGLIWAYTKSKINNRFLMLGLGLVFVFDLWMVGRRYLNNDNFVTSTEYNKNFLPRPADEQILQDKDPNFRVFDLSVDPFQSAQPSYFHKNIGGYHPAKLQRYQDLIENHLSKGNQSVLNMLNMRYAITEEGQVQRNPNALGNAWFVSSIKKVVTSNEEIEALAEFSPAEEAVIHADFSNYLGNFSPQKEGTITLKEYQPNKLTYESDANSEQLAVFSEIWYGPNKGWQAYVDGNPVDHIRANYVLRAMKVPAGKHTIVFEFKPKSFAIGETVSYITSSILLISLLGMVAFGGWKWYDNLPEVEERKIEKIRVEPQKPKKGKKK